MSQFQRIMLLSIFVFFENRAQALNYGLSLLGGFIQQPTSQYFHAGYGAELAIQAKGEAIGMRVLYFERPQFKSQGFEDQDRGYSVVLSSNFWQQNKYLLLGGMGFGRFDGYTRPTDDLSQLPSRTYGISGLTVWGQIARDIGNFRLSFSHWTHVGYAGKDQFEAVVVWPFSVYAFSLGWLT